MAKIIIDVRGWRTPGKNENPERREILGLSGQICSIDNPHIQIYKFVYHL